MVVGQATVLWEMLAELNSRFLEGYGRVPEELAHYLDPIGEKLAAEMNEISIYDGSHPSSEAISLMMQFRS